MSHVGTRDEHRENGTGATAAAHASARILPILPILSCCFCPTLSGRNVDRANRRRTIGFGAVSEQANPVAPRGSARVLGPQVL